MTRPAKATVVGPFVVLVLTGCMGDGVDWTGPGADVPAPRIDALSAYSASVGDAVQFLGDGFLEADQGYTEVTFRGVYRHDGVEEPVSLTVDVASEDSTTLTWRRFGPYRIPFSRAGNELGTFEGEVTATNVTWDGAQRRQEAEPHQITFEVEPSLVVRDLAAAGDTFEGDCAYVGNRLINFVPYRMSVEAVGFEAESFVYTVGGGLLRGSMVSDEPTTFEHAAVSSVDSLGVVESIRFAEVPVGVPVYASSIAVEAFSTDGEVFSQLIMVGVHQPLFVRFRGGVEIAEIMEPEPVSSCMSGGSNGRDVTYSETTTDTRTISSTHTLTSGWTESYTQEHTSTYGGSDSETNQIGFSTTDTDTWSWNVNGEVMVGAEGGFGPFARAKAEVRVGAGREWGGSHSDTSTSEQSWTSTVNYSEAVSLAEQHQESISEAVSETWTVSSSTSESLNYRAYLLPGQFGVFYRQTTRMIRRAEIVALDLCGNESVVGEFVLNDYTWAPDLGMGPECPPLPESTLPEAQCLVAPCDEAD